MSELAIFLAACAIALSAWALLILVTVRAELSLLRVEAAVLTDRLDALDHELRG